MSLIGWKMIYNPIEDNRITFYNAAFNGKGMSDGGA